MTKQGSCIEFNPAIAARNYTKSLEATMVKDMSFELGDDQIKTMTILIGLNTSDFTYGKRISLDLVRLNLNSPGTIVPPTFGDERMLKYFERRPMCERRERKRQNFISFLMVPIFF